jgi:hypothetical protein
VHDHFLYLYFADMIGINKGRANANLTAYTRCEKPLSIRSHQANRRLKAPDSVWAASEHPSPRTVAEATAFRLLPMGQKILTRL